MANKFFDKFDELADIHESLYFEVFELLNTISE